jgi:YHS domain-containing protein
MQRRAFLALAALLALPGAGRAQAPTVNAKDGIALAGYDPVAYFTATRATPGRADVTAVHEGFTYRFASAANRDAFLVDPARYLPKYGGWCAYGMARGYKAVIDPAAFTVAGGRLYLNYNAMIAIQWQRNREHEIRRADAHWPQVMHSTDVAR